MQDENRNCCPENNCGCGGGFLSGLFGGNCGNGGCSELLFFIIIFLLLFNNCGNSGCGCGCGCGRN